VCTGALILAAVALLEGRQATTHWASHPLGLPPTGPTTGCWNGLGATYVRQRWVEDSRFITSAGVSAGW